VSVQVDCRQSKIIHDFATDLRLKGRSDATIILYCRHVRLFEKQSGIPLRQVSESEIRSYISSLYIERFAINSIKIKIRALKQFYRFLHETGRVFIDPCTSIREPAALRILPKSVLTPSEMESIQRVIPRTCLVKLRDRAIISVLYSTAIRLSEIFNLNLGDVDLSEGIVSIRHGKGGRDRQAVLSRDAVTSIEKYLKLRRSIPDDSPALWINYKGNRLSRLWIEIMIKKAAKQAEVSSPSNPHAWRHGLATSLLRRGASIREVQVFLGHASIKTTQIYTHLTIKDLAEVHKRTHPRERDPIPNISFQPFSLKGSEML
jgi:site-specific recombinase XerD